MVFFLPRYLVRMFVALLTFSAIVVATSVSGHIGQHIMEVGDGGGEPIWYVVQENPSSLDTTLSPGVYRRGDDRQWSKLIVEGGLLSRGDSSGLIQLTGLSGASRRREAFAIRKGKIVFFHMDSTPSNEASVLEVGSLRSPLLDESGAFTRVVNLPEITSFDDVSYYLPPYFFSEQKQEILFSVRSKNQMYAEASGFTFYLAIKAGDRSNSSIEKSGNIILLDNKFRTLEQLQSLHRYQDHLLAYNYFEPLFQVRENDHLVVKLWKQRMASSAQEFEVENLPLLEASKGRLDFSRGEGIEISTLNSAKFTRSLTLTNNFDPLGRDFPRTSAECANRKVTLNGAIDTKVSEVTGITDVYTIVNNHLLIATSGESFTLASIDRKLYLFNGSSRGLYYVELDNWENILGEKIVNKLVDLALNVTTISDDVNLVFVSYKFAAKESDCTLAYKVKNLGRAYGAASSILDKRMLIHNQFSPSQILERRIHQTGKDRLFDHFSPTENFYDSGYDRSKRHIKVEASLENGRPTYGFISPAKEMPLGNNLYYQEYNTAAEEESVDGVYRGSGIDSKNLSMGAWVHSQARLPETPDEKRLLGEAIFPGLAKAYAFATVPKGKEEAGLLSLFVGFDVAGFETSFASLKVKAKASSVMDLVLHPRAPLWAESYHLSATLFLADLNAEGLRINHRQECVDFRFQKILKDNVFVLDGSVQRQKTLTALAADLPADALSFTESLVSGLIMVNGTAASGSYAVMYGQRLTAPPNQHHHQTAPGEPDHGDGFTLDAGEFTRPETGLVKVRVYAIDRTFHQGAREFSLVVETVSGGKTEHYVKDIPLPFSALAGVSIQHQRPFKKRLDSFGILYALVDQNGARSLISGSGGINSVFFPFSFDQKTEAINNYLGNPVMSSLTTEEKPQFETMANRLFVDETGILYWADNAQAVSQSGTSSVLNLLSKERIIPLEKGLRLVSISVGSSAEFKMFKAQSSWRAKKGEFMVAKLPSFFGQIEKEGADEFGEILFSDLNSKLEHMASLAHPAEHNVVVISKEIKAYIKKAIVGSWLSKSRSEKLGWNHRSKNMDLFYLNRDFPLTQKNFSENFAAMHESYSSGNRPVLLVDIDDLQNQNWLASNGTKIIYKYLVKQSRATLTGSGENFVSPAVGSLVEDVEVIPSFLYTIASEGENLSPSEFEQGRVKNIAIMLFGTAEEWQSLIDRLNPYERAVRLSEGFVKTELVDPPIEKKCDLVAEVIREKKALFKDIKFDGRGIMLRSENLDESEVAKKVLEYFVVRTQALAIEKGENPFVSIVKLVSRLRNELRFDSPMAVRGVLTVNKDLIENIISDLYSLPLNLRALPENDPLRILADKSAVNKLYEAGYAGNFEFKMRIINAILGQTNSGDSKAIPGSIVLFGKKGTGKTFFYTCLVRMLGLKYYDFNLSEAENKDAQAFSINFGNIGSSLATKESGEEMASETLLMHFNRFLKLPRGKRGFVLFDDVHLTSSKVREVVFSKIRSLFEAKNGQYNGINVRNITMFMTFNPTNDREKIQKVTGSATAEPSPLQLAIATLTSEDNKVDESFFNRWGHIINLDVFSSAAKSNELAIRLREMAKSVFTSENTFFTVTSDTVKKVVERFSSLNARDFLSTTPRTFEQLARTIDRRPGGLYLTIPKGHGKGGGGGVLPKGPLSVGEGDQLETYIRDNFHVIDFDRSAKGFAYFFDLIVNNFRLNFYQELIYAISGQKGLTSTAELQRFYLKPILYAIKAHLSTRQKHNLKEFTFDTEQLVRALDRPSLENFYQFIDEINDAQPSSYFPKPFARIYNQQSIAAELLGERLGGEGEHSRLQLLADGYERMKPLLEGYLNRLLFVDSRRDLRGDNIPAWVRSLKASDPQNTKEYAEQVGAALEDFLSDFFNDKRLIENILVSSYEAASTYDVARIFCYMIDKAIAQISWESYVSFLVKTLSTLSGDLSVAAVAGAQHFLFENKKSLISPFATDMIFENIRSNMYGQKAWTEAEEGLFSSAFNDKVDRLFFDPTPVSGDK